MTDKERKIKIKKQREALIVLNARIAHLEAEINEKDKIIAQLEGEYEKLKQKLKQIQNG